MQVFFISDLHFGHKNILKHSGPLRGGSNVDEHDEWLVEQINSKVPAKRAILWLLGDHCMDREKLPLLGKLHGEKKMLWGNHDIFGEENYALTLKRFMVF